MSEEDRHLKKLQENIDYGIQVTHRNYKRIPNYLIMNSFTLQMMNVYYKQCFSSENNVWIYQGFRIAVDDGLANWEVKYAVI